MKREIPNARFVTHNLQSWIDQTHPRHYYYPQTHKPYGRAAPYGPVNWGAIEFDDDDSMYMPAASSHQPSTKVPKHLSKIVPSFVLNTYKPLAEVVAYMKEVEKRVPGVTVFTIGYTHENRPLQAIEIMNNPNDPRFVWIDGCTHAREWVTVTTALYFIEQIIMQKIPMNFVILPVLNVDGYVHSWTSDRMWRKNRRPYIGSSLSNLQVLEKCTGVDLNRNYDINFGGEGSSENPCSNLYQGPFAFSEPEVRAASELLRKNKDRIKMTLSLHSFNQLWASPFAYTKMDSRDKAHHMRVLSMVGKAVYDTNRVEYDVGPLGQRLYLGSGFMLDWIYAKLGIRDAYLVELRDKGFYGFVLPEDQIWPTATETWNGLKAAMGYVFNLNI